MSETIQGRPRARRSRLDLVVRVDVIGVQFPEFVDMIVVVTQMDRSAANGRRGRTAS